MNGPRYAPRRSVLSPRWRSAFDAVEVVAGLVCILIAVYRVSPLLALAVFGLTLAGSGAYGIYRRAKRRQ